MKPVTYGQIGQLTSTVLILNKSRLGVAFVEGLLSRSPSNITTKTKNMSLPPELWHCILGWAGASSSGQQLLRSDMYVLVQPSTAQTLDHADAVIACAAIPWRRHCYRLRYSDQVDDYERFMANPSQHVCSPECRVHFYAESKEEGEEGEEKEEEGKAEGDKNKKQLKKLLFSYGLDSDSDGGDDDASSTISSDDACAEPIAVPTVALLAPTPILYSRPSVPDVISFVEHGRCCICGNSRTMCMGCRDGRRARENFLAENYPGDCGATLMCPLCIGIEASAEHLERYGPEYWGPDDPDEDFYHDKMTDRLVELSYQRRE
ncbi:hypothetical protein SCUCBS95973_009928 [Sporothrix curviconia]|uniref:Uncharacterized protein n=1 Tax=Sporothrix curviconia TaxID=1260050 RepID=A0ABP0D0P7_9PEZI